MTDNLIKARKRLENLDYEDRIKLRTELIAEYGSSLAPDQQKNPDDRLQQELDKVKAEREKNAAGDPNLKLGDKKLFDGKDFDERVELRKQLIDKYGTSIAAKLDNGKGNQEKDEEKNDDFDDDDFDLRIKKRRIIMKLDDERRIPMSKLEDIKDNKLEYVTDPNYIINEQGDVYYVTDKKVGKRITYEPIVGYQAEVDSEDNFEGSYKDALLRTNDLKKNAFPVIYVGWDEKREMFKTHELDEIKATEHLMGEREFFPVRQKYNFF